MTLLFSVDSLTHFTRRCTASERSKLRSLFFAAPPFWTLLFFFKIRNGHMQAGERAFSFSVFKVSRGDFFQSGVLTEIRENNAWRAGRKTRKMSMICVMTRLSSVWRKKWKGKKERNKNDDDDAFFRHRHHHHLVRDVVADQNKFYWLRFLTLDVVGSSKWRSRKYTHSLSSVATELKMWKNQHREREKES